MRWSRGIGHFSGLWGREITSVPSLHVCTYSDFWRGRDAASEGVGVLLPAPVLAFAFRSVETCRKRRSIVGPRPDLCGDSCGARRSCFWRSRVSFPALLRLLIPSGARGLFGFARSEQGRGGRRSISDGCGCGCGWLWRDVRGFGAAFRLGGYNCPRVGTL